MAQLSKHLIDDHGDLGRILKQLQAALHRGDLELTHTTLDLFWARLAVHIRAEHLHLFPAMLSRLENEAPPVVAQLRQDHDFFMHELGRAVNIMRKLLTISDQSVIQERLNEITDIIQQIEQRLIKHNEIEENQIYLWATTVLSSEEQGQLLEGITTELEKRPNRFTEDNWSPIL